MQQQHKPMTQVMQDIRRMPLVRQLVPQEAGISWPMPLRKEGRIYVTFAFFGMFYQQEQQQTALFPPFATLTLNRVNLLPVEYVNLRFRNPWPAGNWEAQADIFPHAGLAHLSIGQYQQKREELLSMYDEMMATLAEGGTFAPEWTAAFRRLLRLLMEPGMVPFYRALAPRFFAHFLDAGDESTESS